METFTLVHVIISLIGIASGFVVLFGLLANRRLDRWTALFLATTLATSLTGFLFPFHGFTPAIGVGIFSIAMLVVAIYARYWRKLAGGWTKAYSICAVIALYFNVFVAVVQGFRRIPLLKQWAPTQTEPPFAIAQGVVLLFFKALGAMAAVKFRDELPRA